MQLKTPNIRCHPHEDKSKWRLTLKYFATMKNIILTAALLITGATLTNAQFSLGLKAGVISPQEQYKGISVGSGETGYNLDVNDIKFGTLAGAFIHFGHKFYVQPEFLFQTNRTDFAISTPGTGESVIKRSSYQNLQIPVLVGLRLGPLRIHGGPTANYFLKGNSGLSDVNGFSEKWKDLTWGWVGGLAIGGNRVTADIRYEGNFNKFGDQISFGGQDYNFSQRPVSFVFALNYALIK